MTDEIRQAESEKTREVRITVTDILGNGLFRDLFQLQDLQKELREAPEHRKDEIEKHVNENTRAILDRLHGRQAEFFFGTASPDADDITFVKDVHSYVSAGWITALRTGVYLLQGGNGYLLRSYNVEWLDFAEKYHLDTVVHSSKAFHVYFRPPENDKIGALKKDISLETHGGYILRIRGKVAIVLASKFYSQGAPRSDKTPYALVITDAELMGEPRFIPQGKE